METLQKYCLRWNNYQTNLVKVFDEMLRNENFADVTIVCNGGSRFRCHRMLLAACSKFFQEIFMSVPCEAHLVVLLKDVRSSDMKHILEYMYTGEVNVEQDEISSIIRTAEELMIKGLTGDEKTKRNEDMEVMDDSPPSRPSSGHVPTVVHSSSNMHSPPHSTNSMYKNPYTNMYSKLHPNDRSNMNVPMWHVPGLPIHQQSSESPSSNHFSVPSPPTMIPAYESPNSEVYHHRRKKFSSMMMPKDTPILRTVLGQGQADSSQPVSLVVSHQESKDDHTDQEPMKKRPSTEELGEDSQSMNSDYHNEEDKHRLIPTSPLTFSPEMRFSSGIANYVPAQKPEGNKRYKQYSNNDLNGALDDVRAGMSALMAAKKHNVPSRTLYDKVKKLGIRSGNTRQVKRNSNGSPPDYIMDDRSVSPRRKSENEEYSINNNSSVTKAFFQHTGEDALKAMAFAAAAHRAFSSGSSQDPLLRYMPYNHLSPHSPSNSENQSVTPEREKDYDEDKVEDLSMNRRQEGVIVPPMSQATSMVKEENQRDRNEKSGRSSFEKTTS